MLFFHLTLSVPFHTIRDNLKGWASSIGREWSLCLVSNLCLSTKYLEMYVYESCLPKYSKSTLLDMTAVLLLYRCNFPQSLCLFLCSLSNISFPKLLISCWCILRYFMKLQVTLLVPNFRTLKLLGYKLNLVCQSTCVTGAIFLV